MRNRGWAAAGAATGMGGLVLLLAACGSSGTNTNAGAAYSGSGMGTSPSASAMSGSGTTATLTTKATSIGDVLAVQAQLETLQSQIQQLQGQLAVLASETDYSKITTVVSEPGAVHHHPAAAVPSGLDRAWHGSVHGFVAGAEGLIRIAGPALFALLCLAAALLGGQVLWRRLQRHNL